MRALAGARASTPAPAAGERHDGHECAGARAPARSASRQVVLREEQHVDARQVARRDPAHSRAETLPSASKARSQPCALAPTSSASNARRRPAGELTGHAAPSSSASGARHSSGSASRPMSSARADRTCRRVPSARVDVHEARGGGGRLQEDRHAGQVAGGVEVGPGARSGSRPPSPAAARPAPRRRPSRRATSGCRRAVQVHVADASRRGMPSGSALAFSNRRELALVGLGDGHRVAAGEAGGAVAAGRGRRPRPAAAPRARGRPRLSAPM